GFDRVTGGIVWTPFSLLPTGLGRARVHLGTNMPDASVLALPEPDRELLMRRMRRMGRNAQTLAERLDEHLTGRTKGSVAHVVYPGLPSHSSAPWAKERWFHGSTLVLAFRTGFRTVARYQAFVNRVIDLARNARVDLVSGTSFGLDVTRVYLTAVHATDVTRPFVRVSVGTETAAEIEALTDVFISAIDSL
ncbi:MAG: hypothetical protein RLZZ324_317, partial [Candidatus Parcubacteria bacterium]